MLRFFRLFILSLSAIAAAPPAVRVPARFEPADGPQSRWTSQGFGYAASFAPSHIELAGRSSGGMRMELVGASPASTMRGEDSLASHSSYFRGAHGLETGFIVAPGADPAQIQLRFPGRRLSLDKLGALRDRDTDEVLLAAPAAYQTGDGAAKKFVASEFQIAASDRASFRVRHWDRSRTLTIDPVLTYATFVGGSGRDTMVGIERGPDGSIYVVGTTTSVDLPQAVSLGSLLNRPVVLPEPDVFVAHYSADGSTLRYVVYVGGDLLNSATSMAVDPLGRATVVGYTYSTNFPTTPTLLINPLSPRLFDGFIFRLSADGSSLDYSGLLGIVSSLWGYLSPSPLPPLLVGVDASGTATIAGTAVINYNHRVISITPTNNALQSGIAGDADAFLIRLSPNGSPTQWATYYGGSGTELLQGLSVDASGSVYLVDQTNSFDLAVSHPFQTAPSPPNSAGLLPYMAGFFAKIAGGGSSVIAASYFGGEQSNSTLTSVAVDETGAVYLLGNSQASAAPGLTEAPGPAPQFVPGVPVALVKLDATASIPQYMWAYSFLTATSAVRVRVNALHQPCILANLYTTPATPGALAANPEGYSENGFACFADDGKTLQFATDPPGFGYDFPTVDFALDPDGTILAAATSQIADATLLPAGAAPQPNPGGVVDGYIFKISPQNTPPQLFYLNPPLLESLNNPPFVSFTLVGANFSQGMSLLINGAPAAPSGFGYLRTNLMSFELTTAQLAQVPLGVSQVQLSVSGPAGGTSAAVPLRYVNPPPGPVTIFPSVVTAGGPDTTFNVTGNLASGFTVTWNGTRQALTPNGSEFQFTVPASALASAGTALVAVTNPSPGGGTVNVQIGIITPGGSQQQVPTITAPVTVGVGEAGVAQTINVSGVQAGATVVWNGTDRATTVTSGSSVQFALSASDVAQMGSAQVQIRSGGVLGLAVTGFIGLRVANANVIADSARGQAYFGTNNSVAAVSIPSGAIVQKMDLGAGIVSMFKTDDNAYLWVVTVDGRIRRLNIGTFTVDTTATVPSGPNPGPTYSYPAGVAVAGSSSTIVAAGVDGVQVPGSGAPPFGPPRPDPADLPAQFSLCNVRFRKTFARFFQGGKNRCGSY